MKKIKISEERRAGGQEGKLFNNSSLNNILLKPQNDNALSPYSPIALSPFNKKAAFTLAEVLITLGVIGVVAAITIPSVISHHNKRIVETRLAKFYSDVNQALNRAWIDNGGLDGMSFNDYQTNLAWVNKHLVPYMEVTNIMRSNNAAMVTFKNGSMLKVQGDNVTFYPQAKGKNDFKGKNCFAFSYGLNALEGGKPYIVNNKGITPYYGNYTNIPSKNQLYNHSVYGCTSNKVSCTATYNANKFCTAVIMQNGWKIPDDYPIKF